jgi:MFS family permease
MRADATFHQLLGNNLAANITNFTVWFAVTFWVFLETRSVFATGMVAGIFLIFTAGLGFWFGSLVDHHGKKNVMMGSSAASFLLYAACSRRPNRSHPRHRQPGQAPTPHRRGTFRGQSR